MLQQFACVTFVRLSHTPTLLIRRYVDCSLTFAARISQSFNFVLMFVLMSSLSLSLVPAAADDDDGLGMEL